MGKPIDPTYPVYDPTKYYKLSVYFTCDDPWTWACPAGAAMTCCKGGGEMVADGYYPGFASSGCGICHYPWYWWEIIQTIDGPFDDYDACIAG